MTGLVYGSWSEVKQNIIRSREEIKKFLQSRSINWLEESEVERRMTTTVKLQKWKNLAISINRIVWSSTALNRRHIHEGPDTVEELFERHMAKNKETTSSLDDEEEELMNRRRLTSTRREALHLYRDILRATRFFMWPDTRGVMWSDVLRENARKEFDEARFERDPEVVTRLLINGRDAVESALEKLAEKQRLQIEKERGGNGGFGR